MHQVYYAAVIQFHTGTAFLACIITQSVSSKARCATLKGGMIDVSDIKRHQLQGFFWTSLSLYRIAPPACHA